MFADFTEFMGELADRLSAFKEIVSAAGLLVVDVCALVIICFCAKEKDCSETVGKSRQKYGSY